MLIAIIAVPWMLFPKPFILKRLHTEVFFLLSVSVPFLQTAFLSYFIFFHPSKRWEILHFKLSAFGTHLYFNKYVPFLSLMLLLWCTFITILLPPICFIANLCQFKFLSLSCFLVMVHSWSKLRTVGISTSALITSTIVF